MKISLICSQRNKKALPGSLAATGRLLSKASKGRAVQLSRITVGLCHPMITAGCSTVNAEETAVVMNLPSKPL